MNLLQRHRIHFCPNHWASKPDDVDPAPFAGRKTVNLNLLQRHRIHLYPDHWASKPDDVDLATLDTRDPDALKPRRRH